MKSSLETVSKLQRKLNIEVPALEVQAAFENAYKGLQKHVTVKGFRKGKAPLNTIKSLYEDRVKQDVIQDIIQTHYVNALQEHSLEPISFPSIEFDALTQGESFQFSAEFEVRPEVVLNHIDGVTVQKEKLVITSEMIDNTLEEIRKGQSTQVDVLEVRPAQNGDIAVISFKGIIDGKDLENGSSERHELALGSNTFIPGFEEGIVGMNVGDTKTLNLKFPEEYSAAEIAGKEVQFEVQLKGLKKSELPELNDELAKKLGEYESLDALKNVIREDFEKREGQRIQNEFNDRLMKKLIELNPVDVPQGLLTEQKKALVEDFKSRMQQQGMNESQFEEYKDKWDSDFESTAIFMLQSSFIINKIATEENLKATSQDIDAKLEGYAAQTGIDLARVKEFYAEGERLDRMTHQITEERVLNFLAEKIKVEEVNKDQL